MGLFNTYFRWLVVCTANAHRRAILDLTIRQAGGVMLDCGCGDGWYTMQVAERMGARNIYGIELFPSEQVLARAKGIQVVASDLNRSLPFRDGTLDTILIHHVIEHLYGFDTFFSEAHRTLRTGGYLLISTVNLASWPNIVSLLMGWQPMTYVNLTPRRLVVGNPLAFRESRVESNSDSPLQCHIFPITLPALTDLADIHGFDVDRVANTGYNPVPPPFANWMSRLNPRHASTNNLRLKKR